MKDIIHSTFSITESASDKLACNAAAEIKKIFEDNDRIEDLVDYITGETEKLVAVVDAPEKEEPKNTKPGDEAKGSKVVTGARTTKK